MTIEALIIDNLATLAMAIPSIGVVAYYGFSMIRRRVSMDFKALTEDTSYVSMLESYKKERDELRTEREKLLEKIDHLETERHSTSAHEARLQTEVIFLNSQVADLKELVGKLTVSLELSRTEMHRFAIENAKLVAHVSYLETLVSHQNGQDISRKA